MSEPSCMREESQLMPLDLDHFVDCTEMVGIWPEALAA